MGKTCEMKVYHEILVKVLDSFKSFSTECFVISQIDKNSKRLLLLIKKNMKIFLGKRNLILTKPEGIS